MEVEKAQWVREMERVGESLKYCGKTPHEGVVGRQVATTKASTGKRKSDRVRW